MVVYYDSTVDALEIRLLPDAEAVRSMDIDERRIVDVDRSGRVASIEIMGASEGFAVEDLIERFELDEHRDDLLSLAKGKLPATNP